MPRETTQLQPFDIEIAKSATGPVIHILSQENPEDTIEDIIKGLYLLKTAKIMPRELDDSLKIKEHENYLIMAFAETKRILKNTLEQAEKHASNFMSQLP